VRFGPWVWCLVLVCDLMLGAWDFHHARQGRPAHNTGTWWHIYEETRDGSAPGGVGFGTLFAPQTLARREGKECLRWLPTPTRRSEAPQAERLPCSRQSILFLLACIGNPRCTKACQSQQPWPVSSPRAVFLHSLRLSSLCDAARERPAYAVARLRGAAVVPR